MAIIAESGVLVFPDTTNFKPQAEAGVTKGLGGLEGIASKLAVGAGLAGGVGFSAALSESMDVGAGRSKLAAQMTETGQDSQMYGRVAGKLFSAAYGDNMEEVNTAVQSVGSSIKGMATATESDLSRVTSKTINFAKAFDFDVSEAAYKAGQAVQSGLAENADQAFDLMTASMQRVPRALRGDFTDAVEEYGPHLASLGIKGEQAFALLSNAAQNGAYALDKTGDAAKEFTIRATDMSESTKDAYKKIGLDAQTMSNQFLAGGAVSEKAFAQVVNGLLSIKDPSDRANTALSLMGTPLEDLSTAQIPEVLKGFLDMENSLGNTQGAADRMGKALNDNAATRFEEFKRGMQTKIVNIIGDEVLPKLDQFGQSASRNGDIVKGVFYAIAAAAGVGLTATIANLVASAAQWVMAGASAIVNAGRIVAGWAMTAAAAIASGATTVAIGALYAAEWVKMALATTLNAAKVVAGWVLMGTQSLANAARVAAAWLIAMGPIALVIAAVVGLVALIIANWDTIKSVIEAGWNWVKDATQAVWDWMKAAIRAAIDAIVSIFMNFTGPGLIIKHWDTIKNATGAAWDWVSDKVKAGIDWIRDKIDAGMSFVRDAIGGAWDFVRDKVGAGVDYVSDKVDAVRERFVTGFQRIRDAVSEKISDAIGIVTGFPERVTSGLGNLSRTLYDKGRDIIQGLIDGATSLLTRLGRIFLDKVPDFIRGPFKDALGISSPSKEFMGYGKNLVEGVMVGVQSNRGLLDSAMAGLSARANLSIAPAAAVANLAPAGGGDSYAEHYHLNVNSRESTSSLKNEFAQMKRTARPLRRR